MAVDNYPHVNASKSPNKTVTLADLRELVEAAALLPGDSIVRGNTIPFKLSDLGQRKGGSIMTLAIDRPET